MASIEKRGDLQWRARISKDGYPRISKTFLKKADAERWALSIELAMERGEYTASSGGEKLTFDTIAAQYLKSVTPTKRSARSEGPRIKELQKWFGKFALTAIQTADVSKYRDARLEKVSAQTVLHHLNTLSVIFEYARIDLGIYTGLNPVRLIRKPTKAQPRERRVSKLELEYLLQSAQQSQAVGLKEIITLAVESSCRLGELLGLTWSRIDQEKWILHLIDTKNDTARHVALSTLAREALLAISKRDDGRVFNWSRADSFEKTWQRCVARAKLNYLASYTDEYNETFLEDLRFHDLRHEAISRLFEQGLNPFEVASMSGHKTMQMLKRYTHVDAHKLAQKLN